MFVSMNVMTHYCYFSMILKLILESLFKFVIYHSQIGNYTIGNHKFNKLKILYFI